MFLVHCSGPIMVFRWRVSAGQFICLAMSLATAGLMVNLLWVTYLETGSRDDQQRGYEDDGLFLRDVDRIHPVVQPDEVVFSVKDIKRGQRFVDDVLIISTRERTGEEKKDEASGTILRDLVSEGDRTKIKSRRNHIQNNVKRKDPLKISRQNEQNKGLIGSKLLQNKTGVAKGTEDSHSRCIRMIAIYTSSLEPFSYWPEYEELKQLFEDGRRLSGNTSSPSGFIRCPTLPCDITLIPTKNEDVLAVSNGIILNVAPLLMKPHAANISERLLKTLPDKAKIIFYGMESANMMTYWDDSIRDIRFHYSMTYHSSSDLVHPYGRFISGQPTDNPYKPVNYTKGKSRILAWMASNCNFTFWPRYEWVLGLQEFIKVDIFGRCGQKECLPRFSERCVKMMRSYKFYLALENTQCDEYITEKFWDNCLLNGVVPVVYGGRRETYERLAPPGSFIFAGDFTSPKELAKYLMMLDKDDERYVEFFAWRKLGRVEKIYANLKPTAFCGLLPLLSSREGKDIVLKRAGDTGYFLGCREDKNARFIQQDDINNWSPWR